MKNTILIADDDENILLSLRFLLEEQYYVVEAQSPEEATNTLKHTDVDLILLDLNFQKDTTSGAEGIELIKSIKKNQLDAPVVVMTAWANLDIVVTAMKEGASDFIEKPWDNTRLEQIIKNLLEVSKLSRKNKVLIEQQKSTQNIEDFIWRSPVMKSLHEQIVRIAKTDASILLTGENGTGKSTLAKLIHTLSSQNQQSFVTVNMGAIPADLFESEMFGHKKGAFTGASANRIGRFEMAHEGTLFLDEVGTIPLSQQPKLLRVLETGEYEHVGSSVTMQSAVRLISASNSDFEKLIAENHFREDLFYRLNTVIIDVPTLRERILDIEPLALFFLTKHGQKYQRANLELSECASQALLSYHWPGNLRELSHVMERAVLLSPNDVILASDLGIGVVPVTMSSTNNEVQTLEVMERSMIKNALSHAEQNVQKAAEMLGITASALYRRLDKYAFNERTK